MRLPSLRGRDLTGAERELPGDVDGREVVLLVGFAEEDQAVIDTWVEGLGDSGLPLLEVAVVEARDERFSDSIEGGMRPAVPADLHALTVVVYTEVAAMLALLGFDRPQVAAVRLSPSGEVLAVVPGTATPDALVSLLA